MARIPTVTEENAEGPVRQALEHGKETYGVVPGTLTLQLAVPEIGRPAGELYRHLNHRADSPLTRLQREMLGTVVYGLINGQSCLALHTEAVRRLTGDQHLTRQFAHTWSAYELGAKTQALLEYATKLTQRPNMIEDTDIDALRASGWDDPAIYEATALVGFYNFTGRLEAAAGVPMDEFPAQARFPESIPDGRGAD